jgi:hypothetical protein
VAAKQPAERLPSAAPWTMLLDAEGGVLGAGRPEAAAPAASQQGMEKRRDQGAVGGDRKQQQAGDERARAIYVRAKKRVHSCSSSRITSA